MRRFNGSLPLLFSVLVVGACTSSTTTSSKGQLITCQTQPGSGVILSCVPGGGDGSGAGSGSGGTGTCIDIDEDGDGEPHDVGDDHSSGSSFAPDDHGGSGSGSGGSIDDDDGDGIPNEEDCDTHEGEDDCHSDDSSVGIDLPYDVKPQLGSTATPIADAFAEQGPQPATIVSVTMDGGSWRLTELQNGTPFLVTQADCDHQGNRDVGRDRVVVTWQDTANSATRADHLDIRYCAQ